MCCECALNVLFFVILLLQADRQNFLYPVREGFNRLEKILNEALVVGKEEVQLGRL